MEKIRRGSTLVAFVLSVMGLSRADTVWLYVLYIVLMITNGAFLIDDLGKAIRGE